MKKPVIVRNGRKIKGFIFEQNGSFWYAFGRPSQAQFMSFACRDVEHGRACIEMHRPIC